MPTVPIYPPCSTNKKNDNDPSIVPLNPLPQLLHTPSGLAILELQGTINLPALSSVTGNDNITDASAQEDPQCVSPVETQIGQLVFSGYNASNQQNDPAWMKKVHLYVGRHQRLTGELKKLPKPFAIIQRRQASRKEENAGPQDGDIDNYLAEDTTDELEIVEIVKYKILFSSRPEPVTNEEEFV